MNDKNSLSHTTYRCKDHIVIVSKYIRMIIYNKLRKDIGQVLRMLIERRPDCKLIEAEAIMRWFYGCNTIISCIQNRNGLK